MNNILTILTGILFFVFTINSAYACNGRLMPDMDFDKYKSIYVGEVTGIHLIEYQDEMVKGLRDEAGYNSWTDTTLEHEVTILPQRLKKGSASEIETLKISGCGIPEPRIRQIGLFFIKPNGLVNVIYNWESYDYEDYLEKVGVYYQSKRIKLEVNRGKNTSN